MLILLSCPNIHDNASKPWFVPVPDRVASRSRRPSYLLSKVVPRYNKILAPKEQRFSFLNAVDAKV